MEDEKGGVGSAGRVSPVAALPAAPPTTPPKPPKEAAATAVSEIHRQRFSVELRPGETTIVSWKKLLKEPNKGSGSSAAPSVADPAVDPGAGPDPTVQPAEGEQKDAVPPPNRFSAVIEKIERLYMGKESSDEEELDDIPDDDQYDTEDSFIDDAELDEYFQVDKVATKHNGYYVNRGKLEGIEPSSSANLAPNKRRRKDSTKFQSEKDRRHIPTEFVNMGNMRIKAAARSAPLVGNKFSSPAKIPTPFGGEHYQRGKHLKNKLNAPTGNYKRKSADFAFDSENPPSVKLSNKDTSSLPLESKDFDKKKTNVIPSRNTAYKSRGTSGSHDGMHQEFREKGVSSQVESQPKKLLNGENVEVSTKIRHKGRSGISELPDLNSSATVYPLQKGAQPSTTRVKESYAVKPKGTTLERAIRDLEKIVAESRPPNLDVQEVDTSSQAIKRRLPQEVKQKLGKVARLSATQGKISNELIDRLMGILGHLVQRRTLKRNMKEMVGLSLSANQQKADRFQQIKKEVHEMIRTHVSLMKLKVAEQKESSADDFQEVISNDDMRALKGKYSMDKALEDKICDLYDLSVEGMDEDRGPQSRKLYVQFAELWPDGYMDNFGVKDAIYRSKERKRAIFRRHKVRDDERIKTKRLTSSAIRVDEASLSAPVRTGQERPSIDSTSQALVVSNHSSGRSADPAPLSIDSGHHHMSKHYDKARGGSSVSTAPEDGSKPVAVVDVKKKMKRKLESDVEEFHRHPPKLHTQQQEKEKPRPHQHSEESNVAPHPMPSLPPPGPPGSHQPS